jgi:hypothetical protein
MFAPQGVNPGEAGPQGLAGLVDPKGRKSRRGAAAEETVETGKGKSGNGLFALIGPG